MFRENQPSSENINYKVPLAIVGFFLISTLAFSKKTKEEIWKRDKGKSVISGEGSPLHVAHISHDKSKSNYDSPSNGRLLTPKEHLTIDHINRAGRNGLSENHNNYAIRMLKKLLGIE